MFGLCNLVELFNCLVSCKRVAKQCQHDSGCIYKVASSKPINVDELAQILAGRGCYII